jgi:predicted nucleic acid-binding protein
LATKTIICDTDVIIDYWNKNNQRHSYTREILENSIGVSNIMLSAITIMELINGAGNKNELDRINRDVHQFKIALIDNAITQSAIQLLQDYRLSHGLALPDALIGATSIILQSELFTYNIKDYKFIDGLTMYNLEK